MLKKKDIVNRLAERGHTKAASSTFIDDFIMVVSEALVEGESVMLHGFGTFEVRDMTEREAIDVRSGKRRLIKAYRHPKFIPGKTLKRFVQEGRFF